MQEEGLVVEAVGAADEEVAGDACEEAGEEDAWEDATVTDEEGSVEDVDEMGLADDDAEVTAEVAGGNGFGV